MSMTYSVPLKILEGHIIQTIDRLLCFAEGEGGGASDFTAESARH